MIARFYILQGRPKLAKGNQFCPSKLAVKVVRGPILVKFSPKISLAWLLLGGIEFSVTDFGVTGQRPFN